MHPVQFPVTDFGQLAGRAHEKAFSLIEGAERHFGDNGLETVFLMDIAHQPVLAQDPHLAGGTGGQRIHLVVGQGTQVLQAGAEHLERLVLEQVEAVFGPYPETAHPVVADGRDVGIGQAVLYRHGDVGPG